jgi:hypothetical protein
MTERIARFGTLARAAVQQASESLTPLGVQAENVHGSLRALEAELGDTVRSQRVDQLLRGAAVPNLFVDRSGQPVLARLGADPSGRLGILLSHSNGWQGHFHEPQMLAQLAVANAKKGQLSFEGAFEQLVDRALEVFQSAVGGRD